MDSVQTQIVQRSTLIEDEVMKKVEAKTLGQNKYNLTGQHLGVDLVRHGERNHRGGCSEPGPTEPLIMKFNALIMKFRE